MAAQGGGGDDEEGGGGGSSDSGSILGLVQPLLGSSSVSKSARNELIYRIQIGGHV